MSADRPAAARHRRELLAAQRNEITEARVYRRLAAWERHPGNRETLLRIARDEEAHHALLGGITGEEVAPHRLRAWFHVLVARLFGLTFGVKLMERGEERAQRVYAELEGEHPELAQVRADEQEHERALLAMLHDERLVYVGSIVLGLNDALVELTGALAGLTFAFQDTRLIALSGLVTGIAASLSMAASEYLSARTEGHPNAGRASFYTGIAYIVTVALLVLPYLLLSSYLTCLAVALVTAVLIILVFTFYVSVARDLPFWPRFLEMAGISLGVAAVSFGIGIVVKRALGVEIG